MVCGTIPGVSGKALTLTDHESSLVAGTLTLLDAENSLDAEIVRRRFECLRSFGETISLFPPIGESQMLRGRARDERHLIKSLLGLAPSAHLLRVPARIQAMRSYLVTKFHSFSLLCKVIEQNSELYYSSRSVLFSVMFTIMAEDVYFSCLDEPSFPEEVKTHLANELVSLWDSGAEPEVIRHFPALEKLWTTRNDSPPSFGTMDGTSEILRISINLEEDWREFLNQVTGEETMGALEEFLFGLSYEELQSIRSRLRRFGINAVDFNEIRSYLGTTPAYTILNDSDPRLIYDFYMERKEAAQLRKRLNAPGPRKTLEEMYLKYRMTL
ncbi:MAG: hypothetical protein LBG84_05400 [Treponema sp.]|jgi:hypothetical protein|nr:hypothetical protein [Treponema sp.]